MAGILRRLMICSMLSFQFIAVAVLVAYFFPSDIFIAKPVAAWSHSDPEAIVSKMDAAYSSLEDYTTHLVITGFGKDASFSGIQKLTYTFKKPNRIRVDFESPHEGMTIVFPDRYGKVAIRPGKRFPFFILHVDAESPLVEISPGQHINQTDLGILIENISHSLTDMFLSDLDVTEDEDRVIIRVLSDNPFKRGIPTRYMFTIDKKLWLPVAVEESTADGVLKRRVIYEDLRTNIGIEDSFFRIG